MPIAYTPPQLQSGIAGGSTPQHDSGGLFGFHLPNLGGITAVKQLASGITGLPEIISSFAPGGEKAMGPQLGAGITKSIFDVLSTAGKTIGVPGTEWNLGDKLIEPVGQAAVGAIGSATGNDFTGDQWKPEDIMEQSRREGPIAALISQVGTVAAVAAPIEGAIGGAATSAATAAGAATDAGEAAALSARAASLAGKAELAGKFAHPYTFAAQGVGDLARAARTSVLEGDTAAAAAGVEGAATAGPKAGIDALVTAQRDATGAAAENLGGIDVNAFADELSNAAQANTDTTRLYRRGPDGMHWSTSPDTSAVGNTIVEGRAQTLDVTNEMLDEMRAKGKSAPHGNSGAEQFDFSDYPDVTQSATERNLNFPEAKRAYEGQQAETVAARAEEGAAGAGARESSEAARYTERIQAPTPAWAKRIVEKMPDSVNRVIAHLNTPMDAIAIHNVKRDMERYVEIAQRSTRSSEAVTASRSAAQTILASSTHLDEAAVSRMVGEEIASRLDGTMFTDAAVKGGANPAITDELHKMAKRNYGGIPQDVLDNLAPEARTQLDSALDQSVAAWRAESHQRFQTLLASRKGSKGLESALLDDTDIPMTKGQLKRYRSIVQDNRRIRKLKEKGLDQRALDEKTLAQAGLGAENARAEVVKAQETVGIEMRTAATLHDGVPRMLRSETSVQELVGTILEDITAQGHSMRDVATGTAVGVTDGFLVPVAQQFDVSLDEFVGTPTSEAQGPGLVRSAATAPMDPQGVGYGAGIWNGGDPKLTVQQYVDPTSGQTRVRGDVAIASLGGKDLQPFQASIIGQTFEQPSMRDLRTGEIHDLSTSPREQQLAANYVEQVYDPKSDLNRVGNEIEKAAAGDTKLTREDVDTALRVQMLMDYSLTRSNPELFAPGDFFKNMTWEVAKAMPTRDALFQLVLRETTNSAVEKALGMHFETVNKAMAWYYDSHDYIEKMYRANADGTPKMVTLLNGEQRSAADVFYDLLAVTSVGASPTENMGRALAGMANMDEFLNARKGASLTAQELMNRLDKMQPEMYRVADVGQKTERVLRDGTGGTRLSNKFIGVPEVRGLTEGTQMFNAPKYNVMDVLTGRLKMDQATASTLEENSEWWGTSRNLSAKGVPRGDIVAWLDTHDIHTPESEEYRDLVKQHEEIKNATVAGREGTPLLENANEDTGSGDNKAQRITHEEAQSRLKRGKEILAEKEANASDTVNLTEESFIQRMFDATHSDSHGGEPDGQWGGGTLDTHTGEFIPIGEGAPDVYSLTNRPIKGGRAARALAIDPAADYATFKKQWLGAVKQWGDRLRWQDAAFGVFNNPEAKAGHAIELDPVMMLKTPEETQAVGQASRAGGGAFHHPTKNGYWVDYTGNEYETGKTFAAHKRDLDTRLKQLETHSDIAPSLDQASMEYHGSSSLSKLRSFRDNLADPHNSLAVTMDSVMARMYGYDQTYWGGKGRVGKFGNEIRDAAKTLTTRLGRPVAPHEVQALLWVWTKQEMYRQDWGRLLAYHDSALSDLDRMASSGRINPKWDPFADWWDEDMAFSSKVHGARGVVKELTAKTKLSKAEAADLAEAQETLRTATEGSDMPLNEQQVYIAPDRENVAEVPENAPDAFQPETRVGGVYTQGTKWMGKNESLLKYRRGPLAEIQTALEAGDLDQARALVTKYTVQQRTKMLATLEGGDFGEVTERSLANTTKQQGPDGEMVENTTRKSVKRLQSADENFRPNIDVSNYDRMGSTEELNDRFFDQVRGATVEPLNADNRLVGKLMQDADLGTLVHESGHMLRRLLPENDLRFIEAKYPGILGGEVGPTWSVVIEHSGSHSTLNVSAKTQGEARLLAEQMVQTPMLGKADNIQPRLKSIKKIAEAPLTDARRTAEETFVADMLRYLRDKPAGKVEEFPPFEKLAATLEEYHASYLDSVYGKSISPEIKDFWDNVFIPEIRHPDNVQDPIALNYQAPPKGVETKQFRWESDAEYARRTRQYGEARERVAIAKSHRRHAEQQVRKADGAMKRMDALLRNPNEFEKAATTMGNQVRTRLETLAGQLDDPSLGKVSPAWQPMWQAFSDLRDTVAEYPELADYLDDIPESFSQVLAYASERGFEPTHIPDITAEMAQKRLFGHLQLGRGGLDQEIESGTRKARTGALSRAGLADRSIEALASGMVDATHELYTNEMIHWVEDNFAQPYEAGTAIPEGWVPWDAQRSSIMTGTKPGVGKIGINTTQIIPDNIARALDSMGNPYTHWTFHALTRMTKPWRTLLLTLSPKWYVNNVFGNGILATTEGVKWKDWMTAYHQWRKEGIPLDVPQADSILTQIESGDQSLIHRGTRGKIGAEPKLTAKGKIAYDGVKHRLVRLNESFDEIARAAVYEHSLRTGATREAALTRASKALVDYGDLSPIERGLVRSVIPFYSWQKGVLKLVTRFPVDHPMATYVLMQLGKVHEEMLSDKLHGPIPDAYLGYAQVGGKLRNLRAINPLMDSTQLLTPQGITSSMFPFVDALLRDAYSAPEQGTAQLRMGTTGSPEQGVDYGAVAEQNLLSFPQVRTAQNVLGQDDVYGQNPGLGQALGNFLGTPREVPVDQPSKIEARTQASTLAQQLAPYYSAEWATRVAQAWTDKHPNASESEMAAYVQSVATRRG